MHYYLARLKRTLSDKKGFSLIELSVAVSIAAAATVGFLSWTQPPTTTNAQKAIETRTKMDEIAKAIEAFRVKKKRMPCPADALMRPDNTYASGTDYYKNDYGMEDLDTDQNTVNSVKTLGIDCPVQVGSVPVMSLELNSSYMYDAWGRRLTYHISNTVCGADSGVSGSPTATEIAESQKIGCTEQDYKTNSGNITVSNGSSNITTSASYVLVSHGANGKGAYLASGAQLTNGTGNELENSDADRTYVKADQSSSFDDIVIFTTKNQIESLVNRPNKKDISVEDCEANSQALKKVTLTETGAMNTNMTNYAQDSGAKNTGDQALLSIMKSLQSLCVKYYGAGDSITPVKINGKTWTGAQCPGNKDPESNGSTYIAATDSCVCTSGTWNGNCTANPPIVPSDYTNLALWLDANDITTLFTNSNCSSGGNPANDATIGCWKDKSGNTRNATAGTAPTYKTAILNSLPVIRFNGTNTLLNTNLTFLVGSAYSIAAVNIRRSAADYQYFLGAGTTITGTNTGLHYGYRFGNAFTLAQYGNDLDLTGIPAYGSPTPSLSVGILNTSSGHSLYYYINGTTYTASNGDTQTFGAAGSGRIGHGPPELTPSFYNGDMAEVIIYNKALSNTERVGVSTYLKNKWGL